MDFKKRKEQRKGGIPLGLNGASQAAGAGVSGIGGATSAALSSGATALGASAMAGNIASWIMVFGGLMGFALAGWSHHLSKLDMARVARQRADARVRSDLAAASWRHEASNRQAFGAASGSALAMVASANRGMPGSDSAGAQNAGASNAAAGSNNAQQNAGQDSNVPANAVNSAGTSAGQSGAFGSRFGQLSSGNGSLNGGAGLAGGVGRGFDAPKFDAAGGSTGRLLAYAHGSNPGTAKTSSASVKPVTVRQGWTNLNKLGTMSKAMRPTTGMGNLQQASNIQSQQWSAAAPKGGGQTVIGSGDGGSGLGGGAADVAPPADEGGPVGASGSGTGTTDPPPVGSGTNDTPYQGLVDTAQMLLMLSAGLLMLAGLLGKIAQAADPISKAAWFTAAEITAGIAATMAAAVTALGIVLWSSYGQQTQGEIFTGIGALLTGIAAYVAYGYSGDASQAATDYATQQADKINAIIKGGGMVA